MSLLDSMFGINSILSRGASIATRKKVNAVGGIVAVDNSGEARTDIVMRSALVTELSSLSGSYDKEIIYVSGHTTRLDGGQGHFEWKHGDTTAEDGGTVIAATGGRWIRVFSGPVYAAWYAPDTTGASDVAAKLRAAVAATPDGGELILQDDATYLVSSTVTGSKSITIRGTATIKKGAFDGSCLNIAGLIGVPLWKVQIEGVDFDGNESGIDYNASYPNVELSISYANRVNVRGSTFSNTRWRSLSIASCERVDVRGCDFENGAASSGSADATTTYHCGIFSSTHVAVDKCTFTSDVVYNAGDKTQAGVVAAAPIAIVGTNNEYVTITACNSYDAGNIELYEANRNVTVHGCHFDRCHLPAVKLQNCQRATVTANTITDPRHWWGAAIQVGCYQRLTTYGCLRPNQGQVSISTNVIANCKAEYGHIFVSGALYSTADLDTRILADAAAGRTTNKVSLNAGNYTYTDFDGTVHPTIDQTYLLARNVMTSSNVIDGFATTGIYTYLCDSVEHSANPMSACGTIDTPNSTTKACIKSLDCMNVSVLGGTWKMLSGTEPKVSGVTSSINGVVATNSLTSTRGVARLKVHGVTMVLAKTANCVYFEDFARVSVQANDLAPISFSSSSSAYMRAVGNNDYGVILGNSYTLEDTGTVPAAATEYSNLQSCFMTLRFEDDRRTVDRSRRIAASAADYTTPTQSMSGYYSIGSQVIVAANVNSSYYLCTTAGWLAPAYAGGTTYSKGNKVVNGGEYFVSLQNSNTGHTPTAGTGDAYWKYLGATAAVFSTITL